MAIRWVENKGKRILYIDYRDCKKEQEMIALLEEEAKLLTDHPQKYFTLSNFTSTSIGMDYMNRVKVVGKQFGGTTIIKSALIGISGLKSVLLQGYLSFTADPSIKVFDTEEQALEWLAE